MAAHQRRELLGCEVTATNNTLDKPISDCCIFLKHADSRYFQLAPDLHSPFILLSCEAFVSGRHPPLCPFDIARHGFVGLVRT